MGRMRGGTRPLWPAACVIAAGCGRLGFDPAARGDAPFADARDSDAAAAAYGEVVSADHPLAWWRFEEAGGATAEDAVGGHPGTFAGTVARAPGIAGGTAAVFDGATTRLSIGDAFAFAGAAPYTIELWVRPAIVDDQVRFLVDRSATSVPDDGYQLYFAQTFTLASRTADGNEGGYASGNGLVAGVTTHVVATFDGAVTALYLDGVERGGMAAPALPAAGPGELVLGDLVSNQFFKYAGLLDEVAIYGAALGPARVAAHFAAGR